MIRSKIQKYEMLGRVAVFAARNVSLFRKDTVAVELVKDIETVVEKLSESKASQAAARDQLRTGRNQRLAKQESLRSQVEAIHQTAEALKFDGFSLPENPRASALFDAARNYVEAAGPLKPHFVLHGLRPDFIESLKSAAQDLQAAIESQVAARGRRKAAIQEFDQALEEGLGCLQRFEALLMNTLSGNSSIMASWEVARRLERPRSSRKANTALAATSPSAPHAETAAAA